MARFGRESAADAGRNVGDQPAQDDRPAAEAVARRAIKDLAGAEGDHEGRQGELDVARRAAQVDGDDRQGWQVHVDAERREGRKQRQQYQQQRREGRAG
jgi:hypothetical protein